jgi:hypothetical protein
MLSTSGFKYLNATELEDLTVAEIIKYRKKLETRSVHLLQEASQWQTTDKALKIELQEKYAELELELELAELDRIESDDGDYGRIGLLH